MLFLPFPKHTSWSGRKCFIILCLLLSVPSLSQQYTQQRKDLESKRKDLVAKIQDTKKVLEETRQKKSNSLIQLKAINRQIKTRETIINNVQQQIAVINYQIEEAQTDLDSLKQDLKILKDDYAKSILGAYKARNVYDKMLFVFSSESFNQAIKRIQYLNQYSDYRQQQAKLIFRKQKELIDALTNLINIKHEKMALIGLKEEEKKELETDKTEENTILNTLQQREKDLRRQLAENEKAARKLNKAIEDIIAKEIEEARRKEAEEAKKHAEESASKSGKDVAKSNASREMYLTPEAMKLSSDFESNKNNLPWPVEKGYITEEFGTHAHPTIKGVMINNNGVNIATAPESNVRAVFKGKVMLVFSVPGMGKVVLVSHGKYFTTYAKLSKALVEKGQEVDTKQIIGTVMTNEEEGETEVHFEIWKMQTKLNPEDWLKN